MKPRVIIMSGYGINCEQESAHAFQKAGAIAEIVHINDLIAGVKKLADYDILMFPGGFSYGDDTGSGNAFANKLRNNLWNELEEFIRAEKLILGVCNGFQIMTNLGLFNTQKKTYGECLTALQPNTTNRYECRWVHIANKSKKCIFTQGMTLTHLPIAHGEGRFTCNQETLEQLKSNDQIVFQYVNEDGSSANGVFPINPNGAMEDIAAICDTSGRIMGMMPHPERALYTVNMPNYHAQKEQAKRNNEQLPEIVASNLKIFENAVNYVTSKQPKKEVSGMTYAQVGVDVSVEEKASKIMYNAAKQTFENRKGRIGEIITPFDDFSGVRAINVGNLPEGSLMCMGFDGVGTKVELAQRVNDHRTLAFDLFAMVCDDAIVRGGEPIVVGSILDVNSLGTGDDAKSTIATMQQLAEGYVSAAKEANVSIINGEIAQLGSSLSGYGSFAYHWGAGLLWVARKEKLLTGKEIQVGDTVVAVEEKGFRANGLSLARKIFEKRHGKDWHLTTLNGKVLGRHVLEPSTIYTRGVLHLHGGFETEGCASVHGVVHVTGGGIPGKLGRILKPSGYGAKLDYLFTPCEAMLYAQSLGNVTDEEAYRTWNMGQGLLIITPEPDKVISELNKLGYQAQRAGVIKQEPGINLTSKGFQKSGRELLFSE